MKLQVIDGKALTAQAAMGEAAQRMVQGAEGVLVHAVDDGPLHWLHGEHARGWVRPDGLLLPTTATAVNEGWRAWRQRGFVAVDAALLALAGPDCRLPALSWDEQPPAEHAPHSRTTEEIGIYAIVDSVPRLRLVLDAGVTTAQLRIKQPADAGGDWHAALRVELQEGIATAQAFGARLFINDHWRVAAALGAEAVHLGQEDLFALGAAGRAELNATGLSLGISSHAIWELCRARAMAPCYIACGPVWPTTTKDMPWVPQGLDNLSWWSRAAGTPVVAIGGILQAEHVEQAAAAGARGICVLRGLGEQPRAAVPALQAAFIRGRSRIDESTWPVWPHPTLEARA